MGRIRVIGIKEINPSSSSEESSQGLSGKGMMEKKNLPIAQKNIKSCQVDFPLTRKKVKMNAKKKAGLIRLYRAKAKISRNMILQLRKRKLEKYWNEYMPLCQEEDFEMLDALRKNSKK